jgi:hypothetical protein
MYAHSTIVPKRYVDDVAASSSLLSVAAVEMVLPAALIHLFDFNIG